MIRTRVLVSGVLAMLLSACAGRREPLVTPTPPHAPATLKLADWNMEFLAERDGAGCHPRRRQDYDAMRRMVNAIDADVFAFEEVENPAAAARVFDPSRYTIVMEQRAGEPGGPCGKDQPNQQFIRQAVGFAIRNGLPFDRKPDLTALQIGNPNLRSGVEIVVRPAGGQPLRLLAVHLKSGCFEGDAGPACPQFLHQMPVVAAWVQAAAAEGTRFAILGDWNRRLARPDDLFWRTVDTRSPPDADLLLTDAGILPRCDPQYDAFIDHIVLDRTLGAGFGGFFETTFGSGRHLSDHCPISVLVRR